MRGLALVAVLAGVVGAAVLVGLTHDGCRPLRAADVPAPAVVRPTTERDRACAKAVIGDWYPDGVVDRTHPLRCDGIALALLPVDGKDYSTVDSDIRRAYTRRYLELHRRQRLC